VTTDHAKRRARRRMCDDKIRYRDHDEAVRMVHKAGQRRGTPLRAYPCDLCTGWHITKLNVAPRREKEKP
jgi:hypothetical protein